MNARRDKPTCTAGLASVAALVLGALGGWGSLFIPWSRSDEWGFGHLVVGIMVFGAFATLGSLLAIVSLVRGEKWKAIPITGLVGNAVVAGLVIKLMTT